MAKKKEEPLFVRLPDPDHVRLRILESTRDILESLKKYEIFKKTKDEKEEHVSNFRKQLREVNLFIGRIKGMVPSVPHPSPMPPVVEKKVLQSPKLAPSPPRAKPTELQHLENELDDIEKKIASLS